MATQGAHPDTPSFPAEETTVAEQAIAWFVRLRSERLSAEEQQGFEAWKQQSPTHAQAFEEACQLWGDPALKAAAVIAARTRSGQPVARIPGRGRSKWVWQSAAVAAALALVTVVSLHVDIPTRMAADHWTATGERRVVQLADQSTVTLNTHSAIATDFNGTARRIHLLKGEAFFQVQSDRQRPFVVDNHNILARAVGTEFLVREEANGIRVTVVEGVVELTPNKPDWAPVHVTAGQQVSVAMNGPGSPKEIDLQAATSWLRGRLVFDDARLADVVDELRRYHSGVIVLWNPAIGDLRVSGSYTLSDPTGILTTLAQTLPIRMARLTDRAVLLF